MNLDDDNLRGALRALADDSDSSAAIAATVRARLRRRDRIRRTVAVGSLVAAVAAIVTTASFLLTPAPAQQIPAAGTPIATTEASTQDTPPPPSGEITLNSDQPDQGSGANVVSVRCYATANVNNPDLRNYLAVTQVGGAGTADQALGSCTNLWTTGTLTSQDPYIVDQPTSSSDQAAPELIACLLPIELSDQLADSTAPPSRTIAVLPGGPETCGRLGLGAVDK